MADWPRSGTDVEGASRLVQHGYPALAPVIPDMVGWLKSNHPVRRVFCDFLAGVGDELVRNGDGALQPIRTALVGTHEFQIEALMRSVLAEWSPDALKVLASELEGHLQRGSLLGLNILALGLLQKAGADTHAPVAEWAGLFRRRLQHQAEALDGIESRLPAPRT